MAQVCLGKLPAKQDHRVPLFRTVQKRLITPPPVINWYAGVGEWKMLRNDKLGLCVEAACMHAMLQYSTYAGLPLIPTDDETENFYIQAAHYNPADPNTDQGSYVLGQGGVMEYWHNTGITVGGVRNKVKAYLQLSLGDTLEWRQAIWVFGGMMVGFRVPDYIMEPEEIPYVWDYRPGGKPVGGHEVWVNGCMEVAGERYYETVSWGQRYRMTERFMLANMDEALAIYDPAVLNSRGVDARGLPETELLALMSSMQRYGGPVA